MAQTSEIMKSIVILLAFGVAAGYYFVLANAAMIRQNWPAMKCDPRVMPFAGIVNAPDDVSAGEYTASNFAECLASTGKYLGEEATLPVHYLVSGVGDTVSALGEATQASRNAVNQIRSAMQSVADEASTRTLGAAIPLVGTASNLKAGLKKTQAVGGIGLFAAEGLLLGASASVGAFVEFLLIMAGIFVASGGVLLAIPFCLGCPVGIPLLALGIAVMAVCIAVIAIVMPHIPASGL